jgi:hypothetical protein
MKGKISVIILFLEKLKMVEYVQRSPPDSWYGLKIPHNIL